MDKEFFKKNLGEDDVDEKVLETLAGWLQAFCNMRKHIYFKEGNEPIEINMMNYDQLIKGLLKYLKNNPEQESLLHKMIEEYYEYTIKIAETISGQDSNHVKVCNAICPKNFDDIIFYTGIVKEDE